MSDENIKSRIRGFMARSFEGREFADDDDIFALGFGNSLFAIQLVQFMESAFKVEIEAEDLDMANFRSIQAVSALVARKLGPAASAGASGRG
jgi:acyl carrier protein